MYEKSPRKQAADILLYQADIVPVGVDQAQHLELTRTLARKFNNQFCKPMKPLFVEPRTLHTPTPKIIGLDGQRKMSKTYDNYIALTESEADLKQKLRLAATDPARIKRTDPGNPDVCNVFSMHKMFSDVETQKWANRGCKTAEIGCVQCKGSVFDSINNFIGPIREKYHELIKRPDDLHDVLAHGASKARAHTSKVMMKVNKLVGTQG